MSVEAVAALRVVHRHLDDVIDRFGESDWSRPSACPGWRVQDVIAHLASTIRQAVDPDPLLAAELAAATGAEDRVDRMVEARRAYSPDRVVRELVEHRPAWLSGLEALQVEPRASTTMQMLDLGEYPTHLLAEAFVFDHFCHLWIDLLGPDGPALGIEAPRAPAEVVRAATAWMLAGLARMQHDLMRATVTMPLLLELTGPGGGRWRIEPATGPDSLVRVVEDVSGSEPSATITSSAYDFVRWGTTRAPWRNLCAVRGDRRAAEPFLDALDIV